MLIRGAIAADFRKGEKTREEITDLMAGGETMAELEAEIEAHQTTHGGHAPQAKPELPAPPSWLSPRAPPSSSAQPLS